jgi:hypothetical protein
MPTHARVVDQDVQLAERFFRFGEETLNFFGLGNIGLDGDGLPAVLRDVIDDRLGAGLAAGIVDDDGGALGRHVFRDRGADSLGCPRNQGDFSFHSSDPRESPLVALIWIHSQLRNSRVPGCEGKAGIVTLAQEVGLH